MALTDVEPEAGGVAEAAVRIRELAGSALNHAETALLKMRNIVRDHGRAAIAAELGSDAAAMLSVYNALKDAVELGRGITVDTLPE